MRADVGPKRAAGPVPKGASRALKLTSMGALGFAASCASRAEAPLAPPPMAPPVAQAPAPAPTPFPVASTTPSAPLGPTPGGLIYFPCQADNQCLAHRCNVARGQCTWPCQAHTDCQPGFQCISPACVPAFGPR